MAPPPSIVYELAPLGVIVKLFPAQILPLLTLIVGVVLTVTEDVANVFDTHPAALVPTTV